MRNASTCVTCIIVTYNSAPFIDRCVQAIPEETPIVIVDSGSKDLRYLEKLKPRCTVILGGKEIGFCRANNLGFQSLLDKLPPYLLFLNPDTFLTPEWISKALHTMENNPQCGCLSGILEGYHLEDEQPTGCYDSSGIFRTFYGRWYDRYQREAIKKRPLTEIEEVPALCGALLLCRTEALQQVLIRKDEIFDESFYMYKEDIDLSLRLKQAGYQILVNPLLHAYHCRGWQKRRKIPRRLRLCSARNEVRLHLRELSFCSLYSLAKYVAVLLFNL